jgi:purine-nucleoside phosphorylase
MFAREPGDYARSVLLPGDPLRAKYIAETYLGTSSSGTGSAVCSVHGTYNGKPISVQGTGMGCPGATIVFEELIQLGQEADPRRHVLTACSPTTRWAT